MVDAALALRVNNDGIRIVDDPLRSVVPVFDSGNLVNAGVTYLDSVKGVGGKRNSVRKVDLGDESGIVHAPSVVESVVNVVSGSDVPHLNSGCRIGADFSKFYSAGRK